MRIFVLLLALGACSQQPAEQARSQAPADAAPATPAVPTHQAAMLSVPEDPAQLKKVEAMGYTVHEDHLHAPGVSTCPKMGSDPVM